MWSAYCLTPYCYAKLAHMKCLLCCFRAVLYKTLFVANEVLQGALIHIQSLCETAKGATRDGTCITLVDLDISKTLTLAEFQGNQEQQCKKAFEQLTALREKVIELVWESCAVSCFSLPDHPTFKSWQLWLDERKKRKSETRMTACVLKADPNTYIFVKI